jgi:hypothetical protein
MVVFPEFGSPMSPIFMVLSSLLFVNGHYPFPFTQKNAAPIPSRGGFREADYLEDTIRLEPISKMSFGLPPFSAGLVSRFPALRDGPSGLIIFVGLKSSKYLSIPPV